MSESRFGCFADTIPDLRDQVGVSSLENIDIAINQSRYYGHEELAKWLEKWKEKFTKCIEDEWHVVVS